MLETMLLAVDGSPHAERAAEFVRQLARMAATRSWCCTSSVLHVIEVMPIRGGVTVELDRDRDSARPPAVTASSSSWPACRPRSS